MALAYDDVRSYDVGAEAYDTNPDQMIYYNSLNLTTIKFAFMFPWGTPNDYACVYGEPYLAVTCNETYGFNPFDKNQTWGAWPKPYDPRFQSTWTNYVLNLTTMVDEILTNNEPSGGWNFEFHFEPWLEPDQNHFFCADFDEVTCWQGYLVTYKLAHDAIKSVIPDAHVVGPAISDAFDENDYTAQQVFINNYLDSLAFWNITIDNMGYRQWETDSIIENANIIRSMGNYSNVGSPQIFLNGVGGRGWGTSSGSYRDAYSPGDHLVYFSMLEESGVGGGTKTCWSVFDDEYTQQYENTCEIRTLDGALGINASGSYFARPTWWTYWAYGDLGITRFATTTTNNSIRILGNKVPSGNAENVTVLLGYTQEGIRRPNILNESSQNVTVNLNNLGFDSGLILVLRIPFDKTLGGANNFPNYLNELVGPEVVYTDSFSAPGENAVLEFNDQSVIGTDVSQGEVYVVRIQSS